MKKSSAVGIEPFNAGQLFNLAATANNSQDVAKFSQALNQIDSNFRFNEGDDTALIIPTLYQRYQEFADSGKTKMADEITSCALTFLSKITPETLKTFTPTQHKAFLGGPISYRGQGRKNDFSVKMIREMVRMGFDAGVAIGGEDAFQIAVQQTQPDGKDPAAATPASKNIEAIAFSDKKRSDNLLFTDTEMVKLFLLSGKIVGYEGDKGVEEARVIDALGEDVLAVKNHLNRFFKRKIPDNNKPNSAEVPISLLTKETEAMANNRILGEKAKVVIQGMRDAVIETYLTPSAERKNMLYPKAKPIPAAETETAIPNTAPEPTSATVMQRIRKFLRLGR